MNTISTHVLDTIVGEPAVGVAVSLDQQQDDRTWKRLGQAKTGKDGRATALVEPGFQLTSGVYRMVFGAGDYAHSRGEDSFYPEILVTFTIMGPARHYHVPLLWSPFGYSTYRGS